MKHAVILQRSHDKDSVKNKFKETELVADELEGKGCLRELLILLWIHMTIDLKYQRHLSRCESVIPLIMKKITKMCYEYEKDFIYDLSALRKGKGRTPHGSQIQQGNGNHQLIVEK